VTSRDQNMTEKGAHLSEMVRKHAGRAKEKLLQSIGKSEKTTDEVFEEHCTNFHMQQVNAGRLHKDINVYLRSIIAMKNANRNLMTTLSEIYEKEWPGQDMLYVQTQNNEMLWADLEHKLNDQVVTPLNTYLAQFNEMKRKIGKRRGKLTDYDLERHNVKQMQNNPNRNEAKYIKAKDKMEDAKRTYEVLNCELHDELPALYDSRILFLVTNMQTLFAAEEVFHSETSKVYSELEAVVDKLAKEVQKGTLPRKPMNRPLPITTNNSAPVIPTSSMNSPPKATNGGSHKYRGNSPAKDYEVVGTDRVGSDRFNGERDDNDRGQLEENGNRIARGQYDLPSGATTDNLPPGVLYRVKVAFKYNVEDADELNLEVGEIIQVVEYDDPEEQEDGWCMGIKESTGEKGLFPANFTRPI